MSSSSFVDGANHLVVREDEDRTLHSIGIIHFVGEDTEKYLQVATGSTQEQGLQELEERLKNGFGSSIKKLDLRHFQIIPSLVHCNKLEELAFRRVLLGTDRVASLARVLPTLAALECLVCFGYDLTLCVLKRKHEML